MKMINYLTIIRKYLKEEISPLEKEKLIQWLEEDEENIVLFKNELRNWYATKEELHTEPKKAFEHFVKAIHQKETKVIALGVWKKVVVYAAVLAGILFGTYYTVYNKPLFKNDPIIVETDATSTDKIKIVQTDGSISYVDFENTTNVTDAQGNLIGTKEQDQLVLERNNLNTKIEYIEIAIPKGKLFQLTLSDGTKVWLNAASTLKFPKHFTPSAKNRLVYLEGEAFFDVVTNKEQPFVVKTGGIDVNVTGTQFNISSYPEDATVKTTLVEGAVAVNQDDNTVNTLTLTPSYQAVYRKEDKLLHQKKVNTKLFTSWMNKKIILQNESFAELCKRIERTYNVEIESQNEKLNHTRFTGEFDTENIEEILNVFSETIKFTYTIKNKKITIKP